MLIFKHFLTNPLKLRGHALASLLYNHCLFLQLIMKRHAITLCHENSDAKQAKSHSPRNVFFHANCLC